MAYRLRAPLAIAHTDNAKIALSAWRRPCLDRGSGTSSRTLSRLSPSPSAFILQLYHSSYHNRNTLPVPLPPLAEQHRIIAEVERRLSVVQQAEGVVEANLTRAERLRQSILKQSFSGKLVPQDPNDEPASVLLERIRVEREASHAGAKKSRQTRPRRGKPLSARQFVLREGNP